MSNIYKKRGLIISRSLVVCLLIAAVLIVLRGADGMMKLIACFPVAEARERVHQRVGLDTRVDLELSRYFEQQKHHAGLQNQQNYGRPRFCFIH